MKNKETTKYKIWVHIEESTTDETSEHFRDVGETLAVASFDTFEDAVEFQNQLLANHCSTIN